MIRSEDIPAIAAIPDDRVVYVATEARGVELATGDLVAQDLGTSDRRTLFRRATGTPVVSPDRRSVLVQRRMGSETDGGSRSRTYLVSLETGAARAMPALDGVFVWLKNGLMLAKRSRGGVSSVVLLREGEVDSTVVSDERSAVFSLSPSGRQLAIAGPIGGGDTYRLYVVDLERGLPRRISDGTYAGVAWAPDGRSLAVYTFGGQVSTMRPDGTGRRAIAGFPDLDIQGLGWAQDSRQLSIVTTEQFRSD